MAAVSLVAQLALERSAFKRKRRFAVTPCFQASLPFWRLGELRQKCAAPGMTIHGPIDTDCVAWAPEALQAAHAKSLRYQTLNELRRLDSGHNPREWSRSCRPLRRRSLGRMPHRFATRMRTTKQGSRQFAEITFNGSKFRPAVMLRKSENTRRIKQMLVPHGERSILSI